MLDTIRIANRVLSLPLDSFERSDETFDKRTGQITTRYICNTDSWQATYYSDSGWLNLQFSIPYPFDNPTLEQIKQHINSIELPFPVPSVWSWEVRRVDYAYNFHTAQVDDYLGYLKTVEIPRYSKHTYKHGVMWTNRSRAIKFYHKGWEQREPNRKVLRFEVSNQSAATRYLCSQWWDGNTLNDVVHYGRALAVLLFWLERVGINKRVESRAVELNLLRDVFGSAAGTALWVLEIHKLYGMECYKEPNPLTSSSTYYTYIDKLRNVGLLDNKHNTLDKLIINTEQQYIDIYKRQLKSSKNLNFPEAIFFGEREQAEQNFHPQKISEIFGIHPSIHIDTLEGLIYG